MRRIRPDYYDRFRCIADKCTITCCQEWKIAVDADTNRKWKKLLPPENVKPQKKNLSAYTDNQSGNRVIVLTEDHKCPFLNEDKLCKLVVAYGDKVLSETCTVFPREVHCFTEHEEETLMPCCPAVIDLWAETDADIQMEEVTGADVAEKRNFAIRSGLLKLFTDKEQSAEKLLLSGFYILSELYRVSEEEGMAENDPECQCVFEDTVQEYFQDESVKKLQSAIRELDADAMETMEEQNELLQDLAVNYRKEGLYRRYLDPVINMAELLSDVYSEAEEKDLEEFREKFATYQPLMRKFLQNEILSDLCSPDGDIESMMVHFQWIAMEYSVIRHCVFLEWMRTGKGDIPYETVRDYMVVICRMTGYEEEDIYEYLENSFESLIWDWGYLALVVGH